MKNAIKARGFSLIELLVVVAIIGILAGIAYPSYQEYVRKGHRADAKAFLMQLANRQQQYFMDARVYADPTTDAGKAALGITVMPANISDQYTLDWPVAPTSSPPAYEARLTGKKMMTGDYRYSINNEGVKKQTDGSGTVTYW